MTKRRMNGFDAYENAWDLMTKHLWNLLGYNLTWFASGAVLVFLIFLLTVGVFKSWSTFFVLSLVVFLFLSPVWEAANIVRYGRDSSSATSELPLMRIILARFLFLMAIVPAYALFILPGIYLHCRFSLYLPLLVLSPGTSSIGSLSKSWYLTRSRFVDLYTLWIAVVVSKPACLLPFGLGFLIERPASGLAKAFMYTSCSNRPRDRPT